jgi:hypothetical protein
VRCVCFSPDGKRLASAGNGFWDEQKRQWVPGEVKVWDARTGQPLLDLEGQLTKVSCVCFNPDGQRLAGAGGREVKVWDAQTGEQLLTLKGHTGWVTGVCFSPDGQRLATRSADGTTKVWDARIGQELLAFQGDEEPEVAPDVGVARLCFSPDGTRLASVSGDKTVKVWDARVGQEVLTLQGHTDVVESVCFSFDGQRLVSTESGGKTLVWDPRTGRRLNEQPPQLAPSGARSPDGQLLAWMDGNVVRLLRPPDTEELLIRRARTRLDPDWHATAAGWGKRDSQWLAAAFHLEQELTARPDNRSVLSHFLEVLSQAATQQPELSSTWRRLALAQLQAGQPDGYRRTCEQMQQRFRVPGEVPRGVFIFGATPAGPLGAVLALQAQRQAAFPSGPGAIDRLQTVRAAVLRQGTLVDPESWLAALPKDEKVLRGAVLCRASKHADARKELEGLQEPVALLFRALAEHGRSNPDGARQALQQALAQLPPEKIDLFQQTPLPWDQRVEIATLRGEVVALLAAE